MKKTQSSAPTPDQSGLGSNGNERVLYIPQSSRAKASPSDPLMSYLGHMLRDVLPLCRDVVDIFYNHSPPGYVE